MALFEMAIEGSVNRLVQPAAGSAENCQKLIDGFTDANLAAGQPRPDGFRQGMADGAKNIMRVQAMKAELRRNGCDTSGNDGAFRPVEAQMAAGDTSPVTVDGNATGAIGQPMFDPTPSR